MITISITDSTGMFHSKTRPTFLWAWRALMKAHPDLVPTLYANAKTFTGFSITYTPLLNSFMAIQIGPFWQKPGLWIWRNR